MTDHDEQAKGLLFKTDGQAGDDDYPTPHHKADETRLPDMA